MLKADIFPVSIPPTHPHYSTGETLVTSQTVLFPSELGWMAVVAEGSTVCELTFGYDSPGAALAGLRAATGVPIDRPRGPLRQIVARLQAFARAPEDQFLDVELDLERLTEFQRRTVEHCRSIPIGETITYAELAELAGRPRAARAVGQVMATNRIPLIIPCHRVVGSNGSLGGYSARDGLRMKRRLLDLERTQVTSVSQVASGLACAEK
jgi:methylated-DNA-[protein]-cysteine S-methyltransferase